MSKCKYCGRKKNATKINQNNCNIILNLVKKNFSITEIKLKIIITLSQFKLFSLHKMKKQVSI